MVAALLLAVGAGDGPRRRVAAHPLHTTMAEVTVDRARGTVRVVVRVFADDFGTAVERLERPDRGTTRAATYVGRAISFVDETRRPLRLATAGRDGKAICSGFAPRPRVAPSRARFRSATRCSASCSPIR